MHLEAAYNDGLPTKIRIIKDRRFSDFSELLEELYKRQISSNVHSDDSIEGDVGIVRKLVDSEKLDGEGNDKIFGDDCPRVSWDKPRKSRKLQEFSKTDLSILDAILEQISTRLQTVSQVE